MISKKALFWSAGVGILALVLIIGLFLVKSGIIVVELDDLGEKVADKQPTEAALNSDINELKTVEPTFSAIRAFFVSLAQKDGGVYAFEVLKRATLPPNTDLHLMGHAVGDELYKQDGLEGIKYCTQDFRNACSHSIVVGALLADGLSVFDKVNDICHKAPGGSGAYTMCFHGFGHGVLAYTNYEVPEAVKLCEKVGTKEYNNEEASQCIGGIVMEMNQGINDPATWATKKDKYLAKDDPLRLCKADYMPEDAKVLCYSYITPYIFDAAGAINGNPSPDMYPKSFAYCDEVENDVQRYACYGGLGKEFIVLSQDRDIRKMEDTPDKNLKLTASWCDLAAKDEAKKACTESVIDSLFWGGENNPTVSVRYCSLLESSMLKDTCFNHLFDVAHYYQADKTRLQMICSLVPEAYKDQCSALLLK